MTRQGVREKIDTLLDQVREDHLRYAVAVLSHPGERIDPGDYAHREDEIVALVVGLLDGTLLDEDDVPAEVSA